MSTDGTPLILHRSPMKVTWWIGKVWVRNWNMNLNFTYKVHIISISRMRVDDLALCQWAHVVWGGISRKPLEIETSFRRTTNRKWPMPSRIITWPMMSHDLERSSWWPQYAWCPVSRKRMKIQTWLQWSSYRKWGMTSHMVTWPMTSCESERSRSWPNMFGAQYLENG